MALESDQCPAEAAEIAEAYSMGTLSEADAADFEAHLLACADCRTAVERADAYVRAMRAAAQEIRRRE